MPVNMVRQDMTKATKMVFEPVAGTVDWVVSRVSDPAKTALGLTSVFWSARLLKTETCAVSPFTS